MTKPSESSRQPARFFIEVTQEYAWVMANRCPEPTRTRLRNEIYTSDMEHRARANILLEGLGIEPMQLPKRRAKK